MLRTPTRGRSRGRCGFCSGGVRLGHGSKLEESPDMQGPLSAKGGRGDGSAGLLLTIGPHGEEKLGRPAAVVGLRARERERDRAVA